MGETENKMLEQALVDARVDLENPNYYGTRPDKEMNSEHPVSESLLHLFTASAGSGKTWRLAFEYISLLLKDAFLPSEGRREMSVPDNYRHILAITFTNKATAEMKDRILQNLELLSNPVNADEKVNLERNSYLEQLASRLCVEKEVVAERAKLVYSNLLHDYSHFHIQTIDSFFQSVLRNLAQELGIGSYWEVELDSESVLKEAVHRLLNKVCADDDLRRWVTDYVKSRIDDNKNWNVEGELVSFGANLFSEALVTNDEMDDFLSETSELLRKRIRNIKRVLSDAKTECWNSIMASGQAFIDFCQTNAVPPSSFSQKQTIFTFMSALAQGKEKEPSATVVKFVNAVSADEMVAIAVVKNERDAVSPYISSLHTMVSQALATYNEMYGRIIVLEQILKNINQIGLLADLKEEVANLQEEQNIFMLAYAQPLLHRFITNDDAPFVFERIGESLRYMMIDEFQDTSKVQFQNFRPLIQNCCAENSGSLIVGDAKQAIYRFRNGDWTLIESLRNQSEGNLAKDRQLQMDTLIYGHNMQFNYRSAPVVVNFNNALFKPVKPGENVDFYDMTFKNSIVSLLEDANVEHTEYLRQIYSTSQQFSMRPEGGFVKVCFHEKDNSEAEDGTEWSKAALLTEIERLHENGVEYRDITILSRFNKEIPPIADFLKKHAIPVVSDLAFLLKASIKVRMLVDAFRYVDSHMVAFSAQPKDALYKKELTCDYFRFLYATEQVDNSLDMSSPVVDDWCRYLDGMVGLDGTELGDRLPDLPVYDMAEQIYHLMFPNLPTDVYVQSFLDHLREYLTKKTATLHDVLAFWDDKLSMVSIPADPKMSDGIKMLSIHKSKGLEAHTIILANCSWKATTDRLSSFWCGGKGKLGEGLAEAEIPLVPVDFTDKLKKTAFADEYWEEMAQLHAENVNLLYVALTRARNNLVVLDEYKVTQKEQKGESNFVSATMGRLLYEVLGSTPLDCESFVAPNTDGVEGVAFENQVFQYGEIVPSAKQVERLLPAEMVENVDSFTVKGCFRQSTAANRFVRSGSLEPDENVEYGNTVHAALAKIESVADPANCGDEIRKALSECMLDGRLEKEMAERCEADLYDAFCKLGTDSVRQWFGSHLKVYAESGIVLFSDDGGETDGVDDLKEYRPDRVVFDISTNAYTVIDYKTSSYSKSLFEKHSRQVANYMRLVAQINPSASVGGYVWYVCEKKVVPVLL